MHGQQNIEKLQLSDLNTQFVPRSKHSLPPLQKLISYCCIEKKIAVCSEINAKHINALWAEQRISECYNWWYIRYVLGFKNYYGLKYKICIIESDTTLYFIASYQIIVPSTCFGPIWRAIFRLIFEQVESTINNAFNLRDLVLQELIKIAEYII